MTFINIKGYSLITAMAVLTLLAGCATAPASVDPEKLSTIKRLGIVSAAGNVLYEYQIGRTVFGNEESAADISDFQLDDIWENDLAAVVAATNRFEVIDLDVDRSSLYESIYPSGAKWPKDPSPAVLQNIAAEENLDAIIIVCPRGRDYGRANVVVSGVTSVTEKRFVMNNITNFWFEAGLCLADGQTGTLLAVRFLGKKDFLGLGNPLVMAPEKDLQDVSFATYTAQQKEEFRRIYIDLPKPHWAEAVNELLSPEEQ